MADGSAKEAVRLLTAIRDRIVAGDPAFSRLRLATRAVLSMVLNALILTALTFLIHPFPLAAYGVAVIMSFVGSTAVRDQRAWAQIETRFFGGIAAVAVVLAASLLAPYRGAAHLAFLPVIFAAVYIRRFGQRWFAIGMMSFMAYFMGDYLAPKPADIGWIALAVAIALAVTHLICAFLLPNDPERDFRRALTTVDKRIDLILRALIQIPAGRRPSPAEHKGLQAQVAQLREVVLMAEGFLPQEGLSTAEGPTSQIALALFQLHLAVERLARAHRHGFARRKDMPLLRAVLQGERAGIERHRERLKAIDLSQEMEARLILRLDRARQRLENAVGPYPSPAFAVVADNPVGTGAAGGTAVPGASPFERLRLPVQVTLACGLAMGAGLFVSPARWYWAVIAAFIVFNNTRSRADTALRAFSRSAGTFGGILAGAVLATLLHGQMAAELAILPVTFFFAFYFLQTSYSLMIFFITVALALLYGLMGMFAPALLVLRLEETLIGSAIGTLVAFVVFPIRASPGLATALDRYFDALDGLVEAVGSGQDPGGIRQKLLGSSHEIDLAYADVASAARPLGGPWAAVTRFGQVRQRLLVLAGCAHWSRICARTFPEDGAPDPAIAARLAKLAQEIAPKIAALKQAGLLLFTADGRAIADEPPPQPLPVSSVEDPAFALEVVSMLLDRALGRLRSALAR